MADPRVPRGIDWDDDAAESIEWDEAAAEPLGIRQDFADAGVTANEVGPESRSLNELGPREALPGERLQDKPRLPDALLSALTGGIIPPRAGVQERPDVPEDLAGPMVPIAQGMTLNWADEFLGAIKQNRRNLRAIAGEAPPDPLETEYRVGRDIAREAEAIYREENPKTAFGLSVLGGAALPVPGSTSASLLARLAGAGASGAVAGAGGTDEANQMGMGAALGAPLGVAGQALGEAGGELFGRFLGWMGGKAGGKVTAAEQKALEMGAEKVAADIASAKGKLGAVTQEANRAVENLLRLESTGGLTAEQAAVLAALRQNGVLPALEQKLADSMLEQVPGAAGRVDIARSALEGLTGRANEATDEAAQAILSGSEAKKQIGERVRRYLPTIVGSTLGAGAGGAAGAMLGGSPTEALVGALAGAGVRPAIRAGQRMLAHPAVQRGIYAPLERLAGAVAGAAESGVAPLLGSAARASMGQSAQMPQGAMVEDLATNNPEALGPYADTLQRAAAAGNLSLVHWNLQQTDPQYRAMLEALRKEQQ